MHEPTSGKGSDIVAILARQSADLADCQIRWSE
jgi:hypothetical protein